MIESNSNSAVASTVEEGVTRRSPNANGNGFHVSRRMVQSVRVSEDDGKSPSSL